MFLTQVTTPIGSVDVAFSSAGVHALYFSEHRGRLHAHVERFYPQADLAHASNDLAYTLNREVEQAVGAFFSGELAALDRIRCAPQGTPFQQKVWQALRMIPPGTTCSYGQLAQRIGHSRAFRAVGTANARNPLSLIYPCHRVIGSDGNTAGYAGGVDRKRWLIRFEKACVKGGSVASAITSLAS